jgi:type IV secretory pathway TrbF-like protein
MEYDTDSVDKPYYPDVAQVAREMVRRSINDLDSLTLQQKLLRNKIKESFNTSYAEGTYSVLDYAHASARTNYCTAIRGTFAAEMTVLAEEMDNLAVCWAGRT